MKKNYLLILFVCLAAAGSAQKILSVSPYAIPATGSVTVTIVGHNTFFLSHPVSYARLTQPNNSDGSVFTSTTETVISDDSMTATFNISNPVHGGFYDVTVVASGIYINTRVNGVYMTGKEPRRITSMTPEHGQAGTALTTQITGSQMHFLSSTGYQQIGYIQMQSEIDYSTINGSSINYIDSNNVDVTFNIPSYATNGKYRLDIDLQNLNQTNRTYFFTVTGGSKKKIISVTPHQSLKGDSVQMVVKVTGRNLITNPVSSATLSSELTNYSINIYSNNIFVIDSNHVRLRAFIPGVAAEGDYSLRLNGTPVLLKHYAFRVVPPNIKGIVYFDADSNGVMNGSEHGLGGHKILLLPDSIYAFTDQSGNYFYYADAGNYSLQYGMDTPFVLTSVPVMYAVSLTDTTQSGFNFGVYKMPTYEHSFWTWSETMRCNWTRKTWWRIYNPEDIVHQGTVTLIHSANLGLVSTSIAPDYANGDTLVWNYTINPLETLTCIIQFQVPGVGQTVWYSMVDSIGGNKYYASLNTVVACSFDPNDKSVQPAESQSNPVTLNSEELEYRIRFQNTGTDTAFQVVISDTLNPFLDLETFQVIGSSHSVVTSLDLQSKIITFRFENILLPDSNVDEPGSNGYVIYRIKALQGIPDSVLVTNTAYIFFDFNPEIITNTTSNLLVYFTMPLASITTASTSVCQLDCIDFISTSAYATSWQWYFPGGVPSTSTDEHPQGICFLNTGSYDVTLIATNGFGSDTVLFPAYLTVNVLPPPPVLYISNDTLYCVVDPLYTAYQWYDTTGLIPGATNSFYVPPFSGLFGLSVYNQEGCEAASSIPIAMEIQEQETEEFYLYPNPAGDLLRIKTMNVSPGTSIEVTNALGEKIAILQPSMKSEIVLDVRNLSPGIYFVKFQNLDRTIEKRFVKN